ncbi:DUF6716 putative glycosyltransferase [Demequina sp.]|uniref:DUF6716 putative glycosyltransferase n=1 Tax=Demequina sp. TaxID=2050685 RepID=UPI0025E54744|nr:DUF6716 putative glycosyltransferase [Demequina sp.]
MSARRALVVADSDSYLKWGVTRMGDLPSSWDVELVVVANAVTPSGSQRAAAVDGRLPAEPPVVTLKDLVARLRAAPPDLLFLACRGPLIEVLLLDELRGERPAAVIAAGIPGIWFPPTELGVAMRAGVDLLVVHSERERTAVEAMLPSGRLAEVGLASLLLGAQVGHSDRRRVVFAPQALVPAGREDRVRLLDALAATASEHPELDVVIKLRGEAGEAQTHAETASFPELARGRTLPPNLLFAQGPLRDFLGDCAGFVTVSSTAALEAVEAGAPCLILSDFGVSAEVINVVFEGSGLMGTLEDLVALRFRDPDPAWLAQNYFHEASASDWVARVDALVELGPDRPERPLDPRLGGFRHTPARVRRRAMALGTADAFPFNLVYGAVHGALAAYYRLRARS